MAFFSQKWREQTDDSLPWTDVSLSNWNPHDPCFDWKRPCVGGAKTAKNRGRSQVPGRKFLKSLSLPTVKGQLGAALTVYPWYLLWFSRGSWGFPINTHGAIGFFFLISHRSSTSTTNYPKCIWDTWLYLGIYISIITIPIKGEMTIPNIRNLDPGSYVGT